MKWNVIKHFKEQFTCLVRRETSCKVASPGRYSNDAYIARHYIMICHKMRAPTAKNRVPHYSSRNVLLHIPFSKFSSSRSDVEIRAEAAAAKAAREKKETGGKGDGKKMVGAGSLTTRARTRDCALPSFLPSTFNLAFGAKIERVTVNRRTNRWCTYGEISGSGAGSLFANLEEHPGIICCKLLRRRAIANGVRPTLLARIRPSTRVRIRACTHTSPYSLCMPDRAGNKR